MIQEAQYLKKNGHTLLQVDHMINVCHALPPCLRAHHVHFHAVG